MRTLLTVASQGGDTDGFVRHRARLLDLLDVATRSEVDTAEWVDSAVRPLLCGD
ncbi:hypothetical protein ACIRG5_25265 [Lentzea sp. NPDC102401]|uniref:hypothetical protein n=1 Tax=Lentzea sp. NPDC102401 TaxID=3364128 RepID=UPI00382E481D